MVVFTNVLLALVEKYCAKHCIFSNIFINIISADAQKLGNAL